MDIGFLGTGQMGAAMAANLARAGHRLKIWNRSPQRAAALATLGAGIVATPREVCGGEAVFAMLADDDALRTVMSEGVLDTLAAPTVLVNCATISVDYARTLGSQLAKRGAAYVAAPVLGRPDAAAAAQLHILVAGEESAIARVRPALEVLGRKLWPLGDQPEQANAAKLAFNFMLASAIEAMGEACALARAHGVAAADFLGMATQTLFAAPAYVGYGGLIAAQRYEPAGFPMVLGLKDVELALAAGSRARVPLPFAAVIRDAMLDALAHGGGERDWAALAEVAARRAGLD